MWKHIIYRKKIACSQAKRRAYRQSPELPCITGSAEAVGIENFGTHSLRKTWGYWTYKMSRYNIGLIMDTFNHSSQRITLRYIGVNQDQKTNCILWFSFRTVKTPKQSSKWFGGIIYFIKNLKYAGKKNIMSKYIFKVTKWAYCYFKKQEFFSFLLILIFSP